ncbi:MAG TPA: S8 family serine peptidase [Rheinheimera sp.]|uniref:S8 family serine peptidase n=1 Tax=Rheinheimera sp. TaxID=1869214 RepID=UPI002B49D66C|nr:S8 family serine peptidase [Rheinheimera sp.]HJS16559.1 S8 family serine peptidase [Rheinheimera sp.]
MFYNSGTTAVPFKRRNQLLLALMVMTMSACGGGSDDGAPTPQNQRPSANAGIDQSVNENTTVTLSGSGTDADGTISKYSWVQTSGTTVTLDDASKTSPVFTAPDVSEQTALVFELTVTDNDGATATDTVSVVVLPILTQLSSVPLMYNGTPIQNKEVVVSLITEETLGSVNWEIISQPDSANLTLTKSTDHKSATFIPTQPGKYEIVARLVSNNSEKSMSFVVSPVFPFNEAKIEGNDGNVKLDELIGVIKNQAWVYSASLTETELRAIVANYAAFSVIGYDPAEGLLIEFDDTLISNVEALELLKLEQGISSIENRVHEGDNVSRDEEILPDDGSSFNDGGDNWHLEKINATKAWAFTTGSTDILIGVSDSGFDSAHAELQGKVSEILTSKNNDHGNGVAGAIAANTDNKAGMSGINWTSQMVLGLTGSGNLKSILTKDNLVTINSSWAIPGYLPATFDPSNSNSVTTRNNESLALSRTYRKLATANPEKLLVWSAGNGIANGAGNTNGVYGVDGRHHSPALHYNDNGSLQKQENVIFVAATRSDNRLPYYSNYGASVDLAAPASYKSLKINGGLYTGSDYGDGSSGFSGTSSAAPVVTGVASLIYSLYPGFTGKEVKEILIDSATEFVSERYISPGAAGENNSNIEVLAHQIPIVNAEKALEKAQQIIDNKVTVTDSIPDPFTAQANIVFDSIDETLEVVAVEWELQSSKDDGASWDYVTGMSVDGDVAAPMLDTTTPYQRVVATITLKNPNTNNATTANVEYDFSYATLGITAVDTVSLSALPNVEVGVELLTAKPASLTKTTDTNGLVNAYLKQGTYKIRGNLTEYQQAVTSITINGLQSQQVKLNMTPDTVGAVGSLSGQVVDANGNPLTGVSVRVSGGEQTNGFFASATTDTDGNYVISNISKADSDGDAITTFILEASALGYATVVKEQVIVLSGKERVENFTLTTVDLTESIIFSDDFEQGMGSWVANGFWNQIDLGNSTIANTLVDNGYTSLAPDEEGPQALLPQAFSGNFAWWYGQPSTGTFIGTQSNMDSPLSGGRSTINNSGQLTSPIIDLVSASAPFLKLRTWWEIESVNPNENGFDIMELQISTDGGISFNTIKKLNPYVDPNDTDRSSKPFSSGGYNRKPVWVLEEINLSDYIGQLVILRFNFKTNDHLFNGFRGWIIDTLEIVDFSVAESQAPGSKAALKTNLIRTKAQGSTNKLREEFFNIHKQPKTYVSKGVPSRKE